MFNSWLRDFYVFMCKTFCGNGGRKLGWRAFSICVYHFHFRLDCFYLLNFPHLIVTRLFLHLFWLPVSVITVVISLNFFCSVLFFWLIFDDIFLIDFFMCVEVFDLNRYYLCKSLEIYWVSWNGEWSLCWVDMLVIDSKRLANHKSRLNCILTKDTTNIIYQTS